MEKSYSWVRKIPWRRDRLPTKLFSGFPCGSAGKEPACNVRDLGLIPGLGKSPGEGRAYALQYSGLENSMDCIVHGVRKSQTRLGNFHFQKFILWSQSLVAEKVKNLSAMKETWVRSLSQEDSLEKGNGNPLQYSGLENRMDRGAWQATIHGVAESDTNEWLTLSLWV